MGVGPGFGVGFAWLGSLTLTLTLTLIRLALQLVSGDTAPVQSCRTVHALLAQVRREVMV